MKKIIFIEPYASFGGHNYKHITVIPPQCEALDLDYFLITESGQRPQGTNIFWDDFLSPFSKISLLGKEGYRERRKQEFLKILTTWKEGFFIFLTTFDEDIDVWLEVLKDPRIERGLLSGQKKILIQSAGDIYSSLAGLSDQELSEFSRVQRSFFFGFYTELQAAFVKKIFPQLHCLEFYLPIYDYFYESRNRGQQGKYASYLGRFDLAKGPEQVLEAIKQSERMPFFIQFFPLEARNFVYYRRLKQIQKTNDRIQAQLESKEAYLRHLHKTKVGLLPYDSYHYALRATGICEEYALLGKPVVVPEHSWLAYFMEKHQLGGACFDEREPNDFSRALEQVSEDYEAHQQKSIKAIESVYAKRSFSCFLETIQSLDYGREEMNAEDSQEGELLFQKGKAYYFTKVAHFFFETGHKERANNFLEKAFNADEGYWKTHLLRNRISEKKCQEIILFETLITQNRVHNRAAFFQEIDFEKATKEALSLFLNREIIHFLSLEKVRVFQSWFLENAIKNFETESLEQQGEAFLWGLFCKNIGYDEQAEKYLESYFEATYGELSFPEKSIRLIQDLLQLGSLEDLKGKGFQERIKGYLKHLAKETFESVHHVYYVASLHKRAGNREEALPLFQQVVDSGLDERVSANAFFHLGEMAFLEENLETAEMCFRACLIRNPSHEKAKSYLSNQLQTVTQ